MDFLLAFILCFFAFPVFGDNTSSKPRSCSDVRQFYSSKGFSVSGVPQTEISGEHLRVCTQGYTCCTSAMEDSLGSLSQREFESRVKEAGRSLQSSLNGQFKNFDGYFLEQLDGSESSLQEMFLTIYGAQYSQNAHIYRDLYAELRRYHRGASVSLEEVLNDFWVRLLERLFKLYNPQYGIGDEYLECVSKQTETLRPFGDVPRDLKLKATRAFIAARTFVQGLTVAGDVVRKVSQVSLSPECVRAIMKLMYCPHCRMMAPIKPCTNYCSNVMKGCLANQADLDPEWQNLIDALLQVTSRFTGESSVDMVIYSIPLRISEAMLTMQENIEVFNSKVFQACGTPHLSPTRSSQSEEARKFTNTGLESETQPAASIKLEKLVSDVTSKLREMQQYWVQLPNALCNDRVTAGAANEDKCWNGMGKARYLPEVMGDGLASQINNPEVEIDITKPDMTIRQQIMQLKIMTNRLKNAFNGNDVDFQDATDDVSGSGSGMCSDEMCVRSPRVIIPNTDRPNLFAYPAENEKVHSTGNRVRPAAALLLSLATLSLWR